MATDAGSRDKRWGDTTSKQGELSRVFVGNVDPKKVICTDLEQIFRKYGEILGIDVNPNGFAFVQFNTVEEAKRACQVENGTMLHGKKIEIRMFDKPNTKRKVGGQRDRSRSPMRGPASNFSGPSNNGPRDIYAGYGPRPGPGPNYPPPIPQQQQQPPQPAAANDIEIIVINKDQWAFGEMIEKKLRQATGMQFIDILFLHSPQHISMTLNDLFERRTLYAVVIAPINEENNSLTLHILHNQTEHRQMPIEDAIGLINRDYRALTARNGGTSGLSDNRNGPASFGADGFGGSSREGNYSRSGTNGAPLISSGDGSGAMAADKRIPEEISYVLRTTLTEGGVQFLSLQQIDAVIEYFTRERERLTSQARQSQNLPPIQQLQYQTGFGDVFNQNASNQATAGNSALSSNLLDNAQVKAALTSLLQLGAIGNSNNGNRSNLAGNSLHLGNEGGASSDAPSYMSTSGQAGGQGRSHYMDSGNSGQPGSRRHPIGPEQGQGSAGAGSRGQQGQSGQHGYGRY